MQLARVLAQVWPQARAAPCLLLLDEPSASLDIGQLQGVHSAIASIIAAGGAALVVTHDLNFAARSADRLVLMNEGRIVAKGAPGMIIRRDLLSAAYGDHLCAGTLIDGYPAVVPSVRETSHPHE